GLERAHEQRPRLLRGLEPRVRGERQVDPGRCHERLGRRRKGILQIASEVFLGGENLKLVMPAARGRLETGDEDRAGPDAARIVPFEKAQELVAPEIRKERDALQQENATRRQRPKRLADRFGAPLSFLPKDLPERGMRRSEGA